MKLNLFKHKDNGMCNKVVALNKAGLTGKRETTEKNSSRNITVQPACKRLL